MPRTTPVSLQEKLICRRFREARQATKLSQVAFASEIGIDSSLLASYEHGRIPLRFPIALKWAQRAGVNLRWLAEGKEPKLIPSFIQPEVASAIPPRTLFSEAYQQFLKQSFDAFFARYDKLISEGCSVGDVAKLLGLPAVEGPRPDEVAPLGAKLLLEVLQSLPPHLYQDLFSALTAALYDFQQEHRVLVRDKSKLLPQPRRLHSQLKRLTSLSDIGNTPDVKLTMASLRERLKKATAQPGMKSKLAEYMEVPLSNVSQWLSGSREPGGESTLRLLHWVQRQERKS